MRINKYPFFLWLTQKRDDFKLDLKNQRIYSDELGSSSIKAVPIYWIILMKYVPLICLSYFFFIPRNAFEVGLLFVALFFIGVLFLLLNYDVVFRAVILAVCVMNFYFVFTIDNYAPHLSTALTLFVELLMFAVILYDIFIVKGYKNWYYLESFKNEINMKFAQKRERKFFIFFKKNTGIQVEKKAYIKGYFLRIDNETV